jgi:spermidine/putrescine ABC transporter ATP-binding subunit
MAIGQRLDVVNISKYYGDFKVLDKINLVCESGEFVTILGSSGSGKTTLLKVIAGFESSSDGSILINNNSIASKKAYERNIGMLFQNYALFPHMTVEDNIAYPLKLRKVPKAEIKERVKNILEVVKLSNMSKRYPKQLSGGQQQRVALARAIVYNPPLLLLDEPLGALDMNLRHNMQFEIKRITKELGITTISVTHDQEEAFAMSDKICIMSDGKVQQFATPEEIYEHPSNRFVAEFMGTTNIIKLKDITYTKLDDNYTTVKGIAEISDKPVELCVDSKYIQKDKTTALFTLRPESIHLATDDSMTNKFTVSLDESVYLGERVKIKASAKDKALNINLKVNEFRALDNPQAVRLGFAPKDVSLLYS